MKTKTTSAHPQHSQEKQRVCDVLVIGSGAGGLAAAAAAAHRHLDVVVIEKEPVFGGTSARSGGWLWIPENGLAKRAGVADSADNARLYLQHEAQTHFNSVRVDAFLEAGPRAVEFFEEHTAVKFDFGPNFADYHADAPGGISGGRSIVARPFDGRELGSEFRRLRPPLKEITISGMMVGSVNELQHFFNVLRFSLPSIAYVARQLARFCRDVAFYGRSTRLMAGNALVARLAKSCFDRSVPIWTRSPARSLVTDDSGRVSGAIVDTPTGRVLVSARKGVILATGGFPHDIKRRQRLFPHAIDNEHAPLAPPGNTGDGLHLGESVGASVDETLPNAAAWVPISRPIWSNGTRGTFPHFVDRSKPGVIAVTRSGNRFANEADSYHDFCQALSARCSEENAEICGFYVADNRAFRKYGLGYAKPIPFARARHLRSGYLVKGESIRDLAREIGVDADALERTVEEFNRHARLGVDPAFGKGSTPFNRYNGDPHNKPNPCLAPIERGPFYAVKFIIGELGTFAGLRCDGHARVLGQDDLPIPGLYAVGNDSTSVMGGNYPGGGITLGPALTFGYVAAKHIAGGND